MNPEPSTGSSYLQVPVPAAQAMQPDVAVNTIVPGGQIIPLTPVPVGEAPVVNRNQYRLNFQEQNGTQLTIHRIYIKLPILLSETKLEKGITTGEVLRKFKTEAEAKEYSEGKEGVVLREGTTTLIGPLAAFTKELIKTKINYPGAGLEVPIAIETTTERSVLPVTVTVIARFRSPDVEYWAQSFDVPVRYVQGEAGSAEGIGLIDSYVDLQNPLIINPEHTYSLALFVFVPATVNTAPVVGEEIIGGVTKRGSGGITFFYNIERVTLNK